MINKLLPRGGGGGPSGARCFLRCLRGVDVGGLATGLEPNPCPFPTMPFGANETFALPEAPEDSEGEGSSKLLEQADKK